MIMKLLTDQSQKASRYARIFRELKQSASRPIDKVNCEEFASRLEALSDSAKSITAKFEQNDLLYIWTAFPKLFKRHHDESTSLFKDLEAEANR